MALFDDEFNPLSPAEGEETPTWDTLMLGAIDAILKDAQTWLPATIILVKANNRVDIQPLLLRKFNTLPAPLPLPPIMDCMVVSPRGLNYGMKLPIKPGDT